jgi:hypothetical protein
LLAASRAASMVGLKAGSMVALMGS